MRTLGFFFILTWALLATGAWAFEREQARVLLEQRDRALQACE